MSEKKPVQPNVERSQQLSDERHAPSTDALQAELNTLEKNLKKKPPATSYSREDQCRKLVEIVEQIGIPPAAAAAGDAAEGDLPLDRLGHYELLAKLGEGGMGAVYKARHLKLNRLVALKVLPANRLNDPQAVARFEREMQAVGKLNHPNIVAAHDAGEAEGSHYLVMELVDGVDLSTLVKCCGPLPVAEACAIICQAARGLDHAGGHSMVHRDIKPGNLMLTFAGQVKILDMGLALLDELKGPGKSELTSTGQMMGTLDYMAPEQGTDSHKVDIRADVYSLGATLFKLITGEAPFHGPKYETPVSKMMALAVETPRALCDVRDDIPAELSQLVASMLAKSADERPATPQAVIDLLEPFAHGAQLEEVARVAEEKKQSDADPSGDTFAHLRSSFTHTEPSLPPSIAVQAAAAAPPANKRRRWLLAAGLLLPLLLAAVVLSIRTPKGTVEIAFPEGVDHREVAVELKQNGEVVELADAKNNWTIRIADGAYDVQLRGGTDRFNLSEKKIEVRRNKEQLLSVVLKEDGANPQQPLRPQIENYLSEVDLTKDISAGVWQVKEGALIAQGEGLCTLPVSVTGNYTATADLTWQGKEGMFGIVLPVGLTRVGVLINSDGKIEMDFVDGKRFLVSNLDRQIFAANQNYNLQAIVRRSGHDLRLVVLLDGKSLCIWNGDHRRLSALGHDIYRPAIRINGEAVFHHFKIKTEEGSSLALDRGRKVALPFEMGPSVNTPGKQQGFCDLGPQGSELVGIRCYQDGTFRRVRPIYRLNDQAIEDATYPWGSADKEFLAKEGYAVGGCIVGIGWDGVRRLKLVYMKKQGARLDTNDRYESEWIINKEEGSGPLQEILSDGRRAIGLWGEMGDYLVYGLGLIYSSNSSSSQHPASSGAMALNWKKGETHSIKGPYAVSARANLLVAADEGGGLQVRNLRDQSRVLELADFTSPFAISEDGARLAAADAQGQVHVIDVASKQSVAVMKGSVDRLRCLAFSPDGKKLAGGGMKDAVIWDAASGSFVKLARHTWYVTDIAFSPNSEFAATVGEDKRVLLWKLATGEFVREFVGHTDKVRVVRFSTSGELLFTAAEDNTVRGWNVKSGKEEYAQDKKAWAESLALSPSGDLLAIGGWGGLVQFRRAATGELLSELDTRQERVHVVALLDNLLITSDRHQQGVTYWESESSSGDSALVSDRYRVFRDRKTHQEAMELCKVEGGHLARIESQAEHDFVCKLLREHGINTAWIDGSDAKTEGQWEFSDGRLMSFLPWHEEQPNNWGKRQHVIRINVGLNGWDDRGAEEKHAFVCELPDTQSAQHMPEGLSTAKQQEWVLARLRELNPTFTQQGTFEINKGQVVGWEVHVHRGAELADLSPLAELKHLQRLKLIDTHITDLTPFQELPLEYLGIWNRFLVDLEPVSKLKNLKMLNVWQTRVADLTPLQELSLEMLVITDTQVTDLSPIQNMPLHTLHCNYSRVSDLSPLANMPLEELNAAVSKVSDISPLLGMPLKRLDLGDTQIEDLTPIKDCPLETLVLRNAKNIKILPQLTSTKLSKIDLMGTQIADFSALREKEMKEFFCNESAISSNLEVLRSIKGLNTINGKPATEILGGESTPDTPETPFPAEGTLEEKKAWLIAELKRLNPEYDGARLKFHVEDNKVVGLELTRSQVADIRPLSQFSHLRSVVLQDLLISDISPLANLPLEHVNFMGCRSLADVSPLRNCPLTAFISHYTAIADLSPLSGMELTRVWVGETNVADLTPLAAMPISDLYVRGSKVKELAVVAGMPLVKLDCGYTEISDFTPLIETPLIDLHCKLNLERDAAVLRQIKTLKTLNGKPAAEILGGESTSYTPETPFPAEGTLEEQKAWLIAELKRLNPGFEDEVRMVASQGRITGLELQGEELVDINPLAELTSLESLSCQRAQIESIAPLANLSLASIRLYYCEKLFDIEPLRNMPLVSVNLQGTKASDLSPLEGKPLEFLDLYKTPAADFSVLKGMPLKHLNVGDTQFSDCLLLDEMPLEYLCLLGSKVADLAPLAKHAQLKELVISFTQIEDLAPVADLSLDFLDIVDSKVTNLAPVKAMPLTRINAKSEILQQNRSILTAIPTLKTLNGKPAAEILGGLGEETSATLRTWSDKTGKFQVQAELVAVNGDSVTLRRAEGEKELSVLIDSLSEEDQEYIREQK